MYAEGGVSSCQSSMSEDQYQVRRNMSRSTRLFPVSQQRDQGKPWKLIEGRKGEGGGVEVRMWPKHRLEVRQIQQLE